MPRPSRPWFRFYVEAVNDRKIRRLTPAQRWLWVCILSAARQSCLPGFLMVSEQVPYTWDDLADFAGMKLREIEAATDLMASMGMLAFDDELGAWHVPKWNDRQFESDDVTARTAKHRSNERRRNVPTTAVGTPPETEAETENRTNGATAPKKLRDALFDALVAVFGSATTPTRRSFYGKTVSALVKTPGATPDEVRARGKILLAKGWDDAGPGALLKHWDALKAKPDKRPRAGGIPVDA